MKDEDEGEEEEEKKKKKKKIPAACGENNDEDEVNLLAAKCSGDTHYAYGSFGYGYYTPLPDGTAIFTPAFVPPPVRGDTNTNINTAGWRRRRQERANRCNNTFQ